MAENALCRRSGKTRMKVAALISKLVFFFRVKKIWRKPEQAPVLIYDRTGAGMFLHYIHPKHVHILDVRRETLNIYVLCLAILNYKKKGNIALSYKELYIQCVSPLVCLTFIDNDVQFYRLGLERVVKVFVQNGVRVDDESDIFGQLKKLSERQVYFVDYMCVFGASVGKKYLDYIRGELLTIGSLKNNLY
jgi:surface carbohydrate biosynthesis protein